MMENFKSVTGGMSDGENCMPAGEMILPAVRPGYREAGQGSAFRLQFGHPVAETDFAAEGDDLTSDLLHDIDQNVGPDVGLCVIAHGLRRAMERKLIQHPGDPWIVRTGIELPVREGSRAAFPKLDVILRVQRPSGLKTVNGLTAGEGVLPAFQDDGTKPGFCEDKRGKHARRPEADYHGALFRRAGGNNIGHRMVCGDIPIPAAAQKLFLVSRHRDAHGADEADAIFFPRVQRAFLQNAAADLLR